MSRSRMTILPFLLLALSPFVISDSDYPLILCPLCKSKALWNIFMILGRNVEQDQTTCRVQEWQLWLSYFGVISLCFVWNRFLVCSVTGMPFGIFDGTWQKCRKGLDDLLRTRMTTLPFLLLALSSFVIFDSDKPLISCPLCKSETLWNIFYDTW